jgi:hypothetical protein
MKFRSPGDDIVLTKELAEMRDELTPKQIEFAHHLVAQENRKTATECAIMAGYSPKTARQIASQLQSHKEYPKVHAYIRSLQEDLWAKGVEERAIYFWPGAVARLLFIFGRGPWLVSFQSISGRLSPCSRSTNHGRLSLSLRLSVCLFLFLNNYSIFYTHEKSPGFLRGS